MRWKSALAIAAVATLASACAMAPKPTVNVNDEFDPYTDVRMGPISYVTPHGYAVPEKNAYGRGYVRHTSVANPDINIRVAYDPHPPSDLKIDADRAVRAFTTNFEDAAVRSTQYSIRGTAESVKYTAAGFSEKREPLAGTIILLRQDDKTVTVSAHGPRAKEFEIDAAAEKIADAISFTPDGLPARQASPLARREEAIRDKAGEEASTKAAEAAP